MREKADSLVRARVRIKRRRREGAGEVLIYRDKERCLYPERQVISPGSEFGKWNFD
jgi:hypothetical protein